VIVHLSGHSNETPLIRSLVMLGVFSVTGFNMAWFFTNMEVVNPNHGNGLLGSWTGQVSDLLGSCGRDREVDFRDGV
jgi:hypothetical protein